jgi:hypothetical protein
MKTTDGFKVAPAAKGRDPACNARDGTIVRIRDDTELQIRIEEDVSPFGSLLFAGHKGFGNLQGIESCRERELHIRDGTEIYIRPDSYRKSGLGIRKAAESQPVHTPEWDKYARKFREKIKHKETKARRNREKICSVFLCVYSVHSAVKKQDVTTENHKGETVNAGKIPGEEREACFKVKIGTCNGLVWQITENK